MIVKITTIAKLLPLLLVITAGWFFTGKPDIQINGGNSLDDIGQVSLILLFAFVGAETALNVGGEIRRPEKTIPKGIMISIFVVVVLYVLIQVIVQSILGASITQHRDAPLAETARIMFGSAGAMLVIAGAAFSMFGNISGMVLNMPRILFASARDRVIPVKSLAEIHPIFRTPYISVIIYAALGFIFSSIGEFRQLAMLSSASYMLIYLGVVLSVVRFRIKEGGKFTGKLMGYLVPVASSIVIVWVLSKLPVNELTGMVIFILILSFIYFMIELIRKGRVVSK
jgi:APA family basic amino acid/polyamine antiporter